MAYNPYTQNYFNGYMQPNLQQYTPPQSNGFVSVGSEQEARNYPVAPGNSVTFKHDTQPYVYVKTQSFNQMEPPAFKKYRLVEELADMPAVAEKQPASFASRTEIEELRQAYAQLSDKVEAIRKSVNLFTDKEVDNAE